MNKRLWVWTLTGVALAGLAGACGTKTTPETQDAGKAADSVADAAVDVGAQDTGQSPRIQRWMAYPLAAGKELRAIAAVPGKPGVYVGVGDGASVWRLDDTKLSTVPLTEVASTNLHALWISAGGTWYVAGDANTVLHHPPANAAGVEQGWIVREDVTPQAPVQFLGVAGTSDQDVWAVGTDRAVWHFDGTAWLPTPASPTNLEIAPDTVLTCAYSPAPNDVWIGASLAKGGAILHGVGGTWTAYATTQAPTALWVTGSKVFVAGGTNTAYLAIWDGQAFTEQKSNWQQGFKSIAGLSDKQVWAGATKGQLRMYDGSTWQVENITSPPGTKPDETIGALDQLIGVALHSADERALATSTQVLRWGKQPK